MSSAAQIRQIHTLKGQAGLDDGDYRALLIHHGGAASSKALDDAGASRVIAALKRLPGADRPAGAVRRGAGRAEGPYAGKLQSLWISAHNLGVVHDRTDRALHAWLRKRFGIVHSRFLVDATAAVAVIEGLKAWIAREGGVAWPAIAAAEDQARAVVAAIATKLTTLGDSAGLDPAGHGRRAARLPARLDAYSARQLHDLCNLLGTRLRAARATAKPRKRSAA